MDVGQGPARIQGLHGHFDDVGGAWNALIFVAQTGPQGRPGFTSSSTQETRGPVPTDLIGRLRGEAPPRCFSPVQAEHHHKCRPEATKQGRRGPTNRARRGRVNHEVPRGPAPGFRPRRPSSDRPDRANQDAPPEPAGRISVKGPVPTGTQEDDVGPYVPSCRGPEARRGEDVRSRLAPYRCAPVLERQPALAQHHQPTAPPPDLKGQCRPTPRHRRRCRSP